MERLWPSARGLVAAITAYAVFVVIASYECDRPWPWWVSVVAGFGLSVVVAAPAMRLFHGAVKHTLSRDPPTEPARWRWLGQYSSDVTGFIERSAFTALMLWSPEGAILGMGGWLGLKMAATWNRDIALEYDDPVKTRDDKLFWASHAFLSLQTGFVSMVFAAAGGALANGLMSYPAATP